MTVSVAETAKVPVGTVSKPQREPDARVQHLLAPVVVERRLFVVRCRLAVVLVVLDLATLRATGQGVMAVRALAGLPEGVLLWISIGFIGAPRSDLRA